jgi:diacylglycerol kinase family enzyme
MAGPDPEDGNDAAAEHLHVSGRSGGDTTSTARLPSTCRSRRAAPRMRCGSPEMEGGVDQQRPGWRRRFAAAVALTVPVLAVIVAVDLLSRPVALVLWAGCVAGGVLMIWYALTRRSWTRWLALGAFAMLLCAGFLKGLVLLAGLVALLLIFGVAGGYALGPDRERLLDRDRPPREVPPARHGVLIINPRSGDGKAGRFRLAEEAARRGITPVLLEPGRDLTRLAEQAIADGADVIGMAGGDGSQALVATVAMRHDVPLVCVPAGTRNHFALDLGLDRNDVIGALDAYTDGVERTTDLATVNGRVFVNNASLGVYARVVQSRAYRGAKLTTWARMLPDMLGPAAAPMDLEFEGPDARRHTAAPLVMVSNNPYHLRRISHTVTRPRLDTGRLGILAARLAGQAAATALDSLRSLGPVRYRDLLEWTQSSFEIHASAPVPVGVDGEALVLDPPLRFASLPHALRVRLPRTAPGVTRPNVRATLTRQDLTALLSIARGRPPAATAA